MKHCFFDLDGTLARTGKDIIIAWKGALSQLGLDLSHFDEIFTIGPPLEKVLYQLYPDQASPELVEELIRRFKPLYDDSGFPNTQPYPGIAHMLSALHNHGCRAYIVTNKRHNATIGIAHKFGWDLTLDGVWSFDTLDVKYKKPDLLARLLRDLKVNVADSVMIGDTKGDIDAGKANMMKTIGVTWGYGCRDELADADIIVNTAEDLLNQLTQ